MRLGVVACGVLLGLGPAAGRAEEPLHELASREVEVRGFSVLEVHNARGPIQARASRDRRLRISAVKVTRGGDDERRREIARRTTVELGREGDRYVVRVQYPESRSSRAQRRRGISARPGVEVRILVEVPATLSVRIHGASGDVTTEGIEGTQAIRNASGEVAVNAARGAVSISSASGAVALRGGREVRVATSSGAVRVAGAQGPVDVSTSSGEVQVGEVSDSVKIHSVSGDVVLEAARGASLRTSSGAIEARAIAGRVRATSVSGRIRIGLRSPFQEADVSTSSGDVHLGLSEAVGCRLDLRTSSGDLDVRVPVEAETVTRHRLVATVGRGTAPVSVRTASGSILVAAGRP